jgi:hypothetical protein
MLLTKIATPLFVALCTSIVIAINGISLEGPNGDIFQIMGKMTRQIVVKYFSSFRCIIVVAENYSVGNEGNVVDSIPDNIGSYRIYINKGAKKYNVTENLMLVAMDENCLGIIMQVSDPDLMISALSKLSRRSQTRANRRLLFLPPNSPSPAIRRRYSLAVGVMLKMRDIDFFPDLVIARFQTRERIELVTQKFTGETTFKEEETVDVWTKRFV